MKTPYKHIYIGYTDSKNLGKDISDHVTSLKFADSIKKDTTCEITIGGVASRDICDYKECVEGSPTFIRFGFLGGVEKKIQLYIQDIDFTYNIQGTTMTLRCTDSDNMMKKITDDKVWKKGGALKDNLKTVATKHSLKLNTDSLPSDLANLAFTEDIPQSNMSDLEFFQDVVGRLDRGQYILYITNNTLTVAPKRMASQSVATYTLGSSYIRSFKINKRKSTKGGAATAIALDAVDPKTGALMEAEIHDNKTHVNVLGFNVDAALNFFGDGSEADTTTVEDIGMRVEATAKTSADTNVGGKFQGTAWNYDLTKLAYYGKDAEGNDIWFTKLPSSEKKPTEAMAVANAAQAEDISKTQVIKLEIEGDVAAEVNSIITITNAAKRHNGNYFVEGYEHKVDKEFVTIFQLTRNAEESGIVKKDDNTTVGVDEQKPKYKADVYDYGLEHLATIKSDGDYVAPKPLNVK